MRLKTPLESLCKMQQTLQTVHQALFMMDKTCDTGREFAGNAPMILAPIYYGLCIYYGLSWL